MNPPPDAYEVLCVARELIADRPHWTKRKSRKKLTDGSYAYCVAGALDCAAEAFDPPGLRGILALPPGYLSAREYLERGVRDIVASDNIIRFNDALWRRHATVLRAFDNAIAYAKVEHDRRLIAELDRLYERTAA